MGIEKDQPFTFLSIAFITALGLSTLTIPVRPAGRRLPGSAHHPGYPIAYPNRALWPLVAAVVLAILAWYLAAAV